MTEGPNEIREERAPARRVLFITNIPSPYQIDFFTSLAARPEVELDVLFCAISEQDRQFSTQPEFHFPATVLPSSRLPGTPKDWHRVAHFSRVLEEHMPFDLAVLSGSYFMPAIRVARRFMMRHGIPWYYWGENPRKKSSANWRRWLREAYLRRFLAPTVGALGIGSPARETYQELAPNKTIYNLPYSPNLDSLLDPSPELLSLGKQFRDDFARPDAVIVHFAGGLIPLKAPDVLLSAFSIACKSEPRLRLQLAGDGPCREALNNQARTLGIEDLVRFRGFLHGDDLRAAYLASDIFVLPTRTYEGWGVVVQEALAAGNPVIVTDRVGSATDLVKHDQTGYVVPPDDANALAERILHLATNTEKRETMSTNAKAHSRGFSSHGAAAMFVRDVLRG